MVAICALHGLPAKIPVVHGLCTSQRRRSLHPAGVPVRAWHHGRIAVEGTVMRSYLIVANQTLTSQSLTQAIRARLAEGPIQTYVVVPLTPVGGRLTWDEQASWDVAKARLDEVVARLRDMGAEAGGEVGDRDPVAAVRDAMRAR